MPFLLGLLTIVPWLSLATQAAAQNAAGSQDAPKYKTQVAFPNLSFDRPVVMARPDDGSKLLFVVEQHQARIFSFTNSRDASDKQLFLELPDPISRDNEEGLLGLAFHPKYKGKWRVLRLLLISRESPNESAVRSSRDSRFQRMIRRQADPKSEQRVWLGPEDPFGNHNGGCIEFGPDGFLYISLGDSGMADDPLNTGQNPKDFFASILRIDVDHPSEGKAYGIPADNPARRDKQYAHWAPEVYAIGLRNVWKFTFDRKLQNLWAGEVGQNKWEMVYIITNGGNYGWSLKEGTHPFMPERRRKADTASKFTPPIVEYPHDQRDRKDDGKSITGGYVYRGKALPELDGAYIYGDFDTGRIWSVRQVGERVENPELIDLKTQPKLNIAAFGEDAEGELYILAFPGQIHQLVPKK